MDSGKDDIEVDSRHLENASQDFRESFDSATREAIGGQSRADLPKNYYRNFKVIGSFIAFALGFSGSFLAYVMIANVLTIINDDLGPSDNIVWVLLTFVLCQSVSFTIIGRISDIFGRRWYFIIGNLLALIGFIVCSRAKTLNVVIGGSAMAGIGTAISTSAGVIAGELIPNKFRFTGFAFMYICLAPINALAGGIARSMTETKQSWRWVYYMLIILHGLALTIQIICYFPPNFSQLHSRRSRRDALKGLDYIGLIAFAGSLASILLGISWGGQKYLWHSYQCITTIVVGGVGIIGFFCWEYFSKVQYPLVPLHLFANRNYVCLMVCSTTGSMVFYALSILWPTQIVVLFSASSTAAGWISCTLTAGAVGGQIFGGAFIRLLVSRLRIRAKWQLITACCIFISFITAMASITPDRKAMAIGFSFIGAIGIGYMETITLAGSPLMVEPKYIGLAVGLQLSVRTAFSSLADSIFVTILNTKSATNIQKYVVPAAANAGLPASSIPSFIQALASGNPAAFAAIPGVTPSIIEAATVATKYAYQRSFQVVYLVGMAFGLLCLIASVTLDGEKLDAAMTNQIARKIQGIGDAPTEDDEKKVRGVQDVPA